MEGDLPRPDTIAGDPNATEMISVWLAHNAPQIAIRLGMWQEAGTDEPEAWGYLLADVVRHLSRGLAEQCGWAPKETAGRILDSLLKYSQDGRDPARGRFVDR
jgi:hypothetical protein